MTKPWPWSRRWFELKFGPKDSPEQLEAKLGEILDAERITHFETSFGTGRSKDSEPYDMPPDEAFALFKDEKEDALIRALAFYYQAHRRMNAGLSKVLHGGLGKFNDVDIFVFVRSAGYEGEGWRYKLTRFLRKHNLIEEFI